MKSTMLGAMALASASDPSPALAQYAEAPAIHAGALEVPINKSQVVSVDRAIGKALVGNAEIADVLPISERSVYVLGKKMGTTSLTLYGRDNRVLAVMDIAVGPDVDSRAMASPCRTNVAAAPAALARPGCCPARSRMAGPKRRGARSSRAPTSS